MAGSDLHALAIQVLDACKAKGLMVATAESCTGGLVAAMLVDIPGSSAVLERGFTTYSNAAKADMLGVPTDLIDHYGAVSEPVAIAMATGALARSNAEITVAITGVAGPGGGTATKPEGLVHFACTRTGQPTKHVRIEFGPIGRTEVRHASVKQALEMILEAVRL